MDLLSKNSKKNQLTYDDFDDFFKPFFNFHNMSSMKTDIQEKKDKYIIEVDLPGLDKNDIDLNIEDGYLNICINKCCETFDKDKKSNYIRRERQYGNQCRSFYIGDVNVDNLHAIYNKGILTINIPKKEVKDNSNKKRIAIE